MYAPLQNLSHLAQYQRPLAIDNPVFKQHIKDIAKEQKELDKQIKISQARINYIRNKNKSNSQKRERQSKRKQIVQEKGQLVRTQREKLKEQKYIEILTRQMAHVNRSSKSSSKKNLNLTMKDIEFIPGSDKSHPKRLSITSTTLLSPQPCSLNQTSPRLYQRQIEISQLRALRDQKHKQQKLLMYSTKYEKAEEVRNFRELITLKEIDESKKKLSHIKEKQQALLQRLQLSKKFKEQCLQEYLINNDKYKEYTRLFKSNGFNQ